MTDKEKFNIIAERIKQKGINRKTWNGYEYNLWSEGYYLSYREVHGNRIILLEKETEVIGDEYIDYWCDQYTPDDFNFEYFSDNATAFLDIYEDLIND